MHACPWQSSIHVQAGTFRADTVKRKRLWLQQKTVMAATLRSSGLGPGGRPDTPTWCTAKSLA